MVDQMPGIVFVPMFQSESRAGAVAQQPFPTHPVGTIDAPRGVEREAAAMVPPAHRIGIPWLEPAAPHEGAQHLLAHPWARMPHSR